MKLFILYLLGTVHRKQRKLDQFGKKNQMGTDGNLFLHNNKSLFMHCHIFRLRPSNSALGFILNLFSVDYL